MKTDARTYNRAIRRGDLAAVRAIDAELDRAFHAKHPQAHANGERWAQATFEAQQRARCWDDRDLSELEHDPR